MISTVRLPPPVPTECGDYTLDRLVIELDEDALDFRLELGLAFAIYWALPAGANDRLRLALVDGAAFHVDEPTLEADPFVFDLPCAVWMGELGELHDGSHVVRVELEASRTSPSYRCEITRRAAGGTLETTLFAWRAPKPALPPLELTPALEAALAENAPILAAWDRKAGAVMIVSIAPEAPAQVTQVARFEGTKREAFDAHVRARGIRIGAAWAPARIFWVINAVECQVWIEGKRCVLERQGDTLVLETGSVDRSRVLLVVSFRDPARHNHRGLALRLVDDTFVRIVEHDETEYAPRNTLPPERDWDGVLGGALATALGVAWMHDPRPDLPWRPTAVVAAPAAPPVPTRTALLDACRASPDDDAPRLAWARDVGGERGELVVLQCELARGGLSLAETVKRRRRVRELLDRYGAAWSGLAGIASSVGFDRGFVDVAVLPASQWFERGAAIRDAAPLLTSLMPTGLEGYQDDEGEAERSLLARVERFLADPALRSLAALGVHASLEVYDDDGPNWWRSLDHAVMPRLIASGLLANLRGVSTGSIDADGMRALSRCDLHHVEVLHLSCERASQDEWIELLSRLPRLRALRVSLPSSKSFQLAAVLDVLPASLVELELPNESTHALTVLAAHRLATQLERLRIGYTDLGNTHLFAAFTRLRSLDLRGASGHFPPELSSTTMPALRELAYFPITAKPELPHLASLVERFSGTLELLDLRGLNAYRSMGSDAHVAAELARITKDMTGIVVRHDAPSSGSFLHLRRAREASYWTTVDLQVPD